MDAILGMKRRKRSEQKKNIFLGKKGMLGFGLIFFGMAMPSQVSAQPGLNGAPDNVLPQLIGYLRTNLKDFTSLRDMRVCEPEMSNGEWRVSFSLNAKNSYGGYSGSTYYSAVFRNGRIDYAAAPKLGPDLDAKLLSLTDACAAVQDAEVQRLMAESK